MRRLAIDIGGTKFQAALFEEQRIAAKETRPTDRAAGPEPMIAELLSIAGRWRFERCGVGFGGPVDFAGQRVALSTHAAGWRDFPLAGRLQSALGVPVVIDNDANAGALGEARFGAGRGHLPMFYMTLSTGIGGGIVLENGELYRGADSWAGELGHIAIRPDGPPCLCGARGCFERICCGLWLERDYGKPARELLGEASFTRRYAADLAAGLKAAVMLLNPARIVIGGGIAKAGDALFVPLREELRRQVTAWSGARLDVQPAALGDDSVLWGAAILAS
jgi:glucokinase